MRKVLVEACCESVADAVLAESGGADRIELCEDLAVGGCSPRPALLEEVLAAVTLPVMVMVRPRPGGFVYSTREQDRIIKEAAALVGSGASGIVVGALRPDGGLDEGLLRSVVEAASGLPVTCHKAFDEARDLMEALDSCRSCGIARVLTSGGAARALEGRRVLAALRRSGGPVILAGGGVRADHVRSLVEETGVAEVHARAEAVPGLVTALRS